SFQNVQIFSNKCHHFPDTRIVNLTARHLLSIESDDHLKLAGGLQISLAVLGDIKDKVFNNDTRVSILGSNEILVVPSEIVFQQTHRLLDLIEGLIAARNVFAHFIDVANEDLGEFFNINIGTRNILDDRDNSEIDVMQNK